MNSKKKKRLVSQIISGVLVVTMLAGVLVAFTGCGKPAEETTTETETESGSEGETDALKPNTPVTDKAELERIKTEVNEVLDYMISRNALLLLQTGDESYGQEIYNSNGEAVYQDGVSTYFTIFKNTGDTIVFGDTIQNGHDMTTIATVKSLLENLGENGFTVEKDNNIQFTDEASEDEQSHSIQAYIINVEGKEAFSKLFAPMGDNADKIFEVYTTLYSDEETTWGENLRYRLIYDLKSKYMTIISETTINDEDRTLFISDGYAELGDWKLPEIWYDTEFWKESDTVSDEQFEQLEILTGTVQKVLDDYALDHGMTQEEIDAGKEAAITGETEETAESEESLSESETAEESSENTEETTETEDSETVESIPSDEELMERDGVRTIEEIESEING